VKETRARLEAEERADRLEEAQTLAEIQAEVEELLESGEADEHAIAEAIRQQHPEALGSFLQSWADYDPEAAQAYYLDAVAEEAAGRVERDRSVREQVEREREGEIALAFDAVMAKAKLTPHGEALVREIVSRAPGSMTAIETPAQATERAHELVRGVVELQRASEEKAIRQGIAAVPDTDVGLGWADAERIPEIDFENRIRSANVFRQTKPQTVGDLKRAMLEGTSGVEDFAAQHNPRPAPPDSVYSKRIAKLLAR
jgi:hypothetical protein